jgi:hypothetical protein
MTKEGGLSPSPSANPAMYPVSRLERGVPTRPAADLTASAFIAGFGGLGAPARWQTQGQKTSVFFNGKRLVTELLKLIFKD